MKESFVGTSYGVFVLSRLGLLCYICLFIVDFIHPLL